MNTLEIIHLRSSGMAIESLCDRIRESIEVEGEKTELVTLYRRNGLETDIAVHIHHLDAAGNEQARALGLHLAKALRDLGLVEHTVWEEVK